jgi:hypothetical protein
MMDGTDGRVQIKLVGAASATVGATAAFQQHVDSDGNAHIESHGNKPGGTTDVALRLSELGATNADGLYSLADNTIPSSTGLVGLIRSDVPSVTQQTLRLTAKANTDGVGAAIGATRSLDVSLHDQNGNSYTLTNPLPVSVEESAGVEVHDQNTAAALAAAASDNHNYTVVAGTTFIINQVVCDAAGDARYDLQIGNGAVVEVFTRKAVHYSSNSKGGDITFSKGLPVVAGATNRTVRVIRKNMDNKPEDIHTTIVGVIV